MIQIIIYPIPEYIALAKKQNVLKNIVNVFQVGIYAIIANAKIARINPILSRIKII